MSRRAFLVGFYEHFGTLLEHFGGVSVSEPPELLALAGRIPVLFRGALKPQRRDTDPVRTSLG